ncbi:MAG: phosphoglucosamine mutase [Acidobacteria bacterium]|nr:phosphoglucosamine mutase [Acidobacteriota bacterium]
MPKELFGTDGIRGVAGEYPLDAGTVHAFGMALGTEARRLGDDPEVLIGLDTRESGAWIAGQVAAGLAERGLRARFAGVVTTPGVAYLTRHGPFVAGVMISASHNPYQDNGLKVFGHSGYKLPDEEEHLMEQEIFRLAEEQAGDGRKLPPAPLLEEDASLRRRYLDYLAGSVSPGVELAGYRIVVDCGNGAASNLAPELFARLGAEVDAICCQPDGRNINLGCGALHLEPLRSRVLEKRAHVGVAFDGDADRAIFIASSGRIIDGDAVLLMAARWLQASGRLHRNLVVATVMSNLGLEKALERLGISLLRTPVGDKYVLEEMLRSGAVLGGEQSGHVIFGGQATTGDGMLTALKVFEISSRAGVGLDELARDLEIYPQRLLNVKVREKKDLAQLPAVAREIDECERALAGSGRILVRFSGTEPLARVMVEARSLQQVEAFTERIAGAIRREIGA